MVIYSYTGDKRMNLLDVTTEIETVLRNGPIETAEIVDVFLDDQVLHYSDMFHSVTIDDGSGDGIGSASYIPMGDRLVPPTEARETQTLGSTGIRLFLDSSRISDDTDVVGSLVDNDVVQRRIRLRTVLFRPNTSRTDPLWIFNIRDGIVDGIDDSIAVDKRPLLAVRIASGAFAYNERRNLTYSNADQNELYPGDTGFSKIAQLVDVTLKWQS